MYNIKYNQGRLGESALVVEVACSSETLVSYPRSLQMNIRGDI
jgi:hypothetical protein